MRKIYLLFAFIVLNILLICNITYAQDKAKKDTQKINVTHNDNQKFEYKNEFFRKVTLENDISHNKKVEKSISGEVLNGVISYKYIDSQETQKIIFTLPLPPSMSYIPYSASEKESLWVSINHGKDWLPERDFKKMTKPDSRITHLQWRIQKRFEKNTTGKLSYKVSIN